MQADREVARQADRLTDRWMDRMGGQTDTYIDSPALSQPNITQAMLLGDVKTLTLLLNCGDIQNAIDLHLRPQTVRMQGC